jgi:hypothetical protein
LDVRLEEEYDYWWTITYLLMVRKGVKCNFYFEKIDNLLAKTRLLASKEMEEIANRISWVSAGFGVTTYSLERAKQLISHEDSNLRAMTHQLGQKKK